MKTKKLAIKYATAITIFFAVFVVAGAIKAGIGENMSGWIWGGSDDGAGNSTGVGWISMNNANIAGGISYGVNIPDGDGDLQWSAWSEKLLPSIDALLKKSKVSKHDVTKVTTKITKTSGVTSSRIVQTAAKAWGISLRS